MSSIAHAPVPDRKPRVGVVIGSGGIKAFAAIPVLELLADLDVDVDLLVGCSGGSLVCAGWAAGYTTAEMREILAEHSRGTYTSEVDYRALLGIAHPALARGGVAPAILKAERLRTLLHQLFDGLRVEDLNPKTRFQATDLQTGEGIVLSSGPVADAVYASIACFPLLPPVQLGGRWLADGAFSSPLPVMEAVKRGMDIIFALDFTEGGVAGEPKGFLDFLHRSINATARALTRSQMALAIDVHHHEIVPLSVPFEGVINVWDLEAMPAILEAGRQAVEQRRGDIVSAIESWETKGFAEAVG